MYSEAGAGNAEPGVGVPSEGDAGRESSDRI